MKVTGREGRGGNFFSECERSVDTNVRRGDIYYADLSLSLIHISEPTRR